MSAAAGEGATDAPQVLLDANVFVADALMRRGPFRLLLEQARRGAFRLLVPEVVVMEGVNHRRKKMEAVKRDYEKVTKEAVRLFSPEPEVPLYLDVDEQTRRYEREFREKLEEAGAVLLGFPRVGHEALARRAMRRTKPFGESDKGYRDALIWHSVLESVPAGPVALVTNNAKDFGGPKGALAPDLRDELIGLGYRPDRVVLYNALKDFTDQNTAASDRALDALRNLLAKEDFYEEAEMWMTEAIESELPKIGGLHLMSEATAENVQVARTWVHGVEVVDARELTEEEFVVDLRVEAEVTVQFNVLKDELSLIENRRDLEAIVDPDSEDHYALGEAVFEELVLELEADFEPGTQNLGGFELIDVSSDAG